MTTDRLTRLADHALQAVKTHKKVCLDCQTGKPCKRNTGLENTLRELQEKYRVLYERKEAPKIPLGRREPRPAEDRFWPNVRKYKSGCWLYNGGKAKNGYGMFKATSKSGGKIFYAHRFSYELHIGAIPDGMCVCHTCDVRNCVNPEHLWLGTNYDNQQDKIKKGRQNYAYGEKSGSRTCPESVPRGEKHSLAKLNRNAVLYIRKLSKLKKVSGSLICESFGISRATLYAILRGRVWKHV